jgi:catechol 2,3-dioxygenase-like lactoylglutathione lyase family enzyme
MIRGMHGLFYTPKAEEARAFIRDKLGFPHVDAGDGWLIFRVPRAEFGVHPGGDVHHEISFWCDDIHATVADLAAKGVSFTSGITDQGYGLVTTFELPGGVSVGLYEPRHAQP